LVKQEEQKMKECAAREKVAQEAAEEMRLKEQAKCEEEECAQKVEIKAKGQEGAGTEWNGDGKKGKEEQKLYGKVSKAT
jgi:hypothetical protein